MKKALLLTLALASCTALYAQETVTVTPQAGKVYRIKGCKAAAPFNTTEKVIYEGADGMRYGTYAEGNTAQLWTFTPASTGKYYMQNLQTGHFPEDANKTGSQLLTVTVPTEWTITDLNTDNQVRINGSYQGMHCFGHNTTSGNNDNVICAWQPSSNNNGVDANSPSAWKLIEVAMTDEYLPLVVRNYAVSQANLTAADAEAITNTAMESANATEGDYDAKYSAAKTAVDNALQVTLTTGNYLYYNYPGQIRHAERYTKSIRLTDDRQSHAATYTTTQTAARTGKVYNDLTASGSFSTRAGATITVTPFEANGHAMQKKLFIDWDGNGQFDTPDGGFYNDDHSLKADAELVSYIRTNIGGNWYGPDGTQLTAGENGNYQTPMTFTLPEGKTGDFRCRYVVAWACDNPAGSPQNMDNHGGIIIDFMIHIDGALDLTNEHTAYAEKWIAKLGNNEFLKNAVAGKQPADFIPAGYSTEGKDADQIHADIDKEVSKFVHEQLANKFVFFKNVRSGKYLSSSGMMITAKDAKNERALWKIRPIYDNEETQAVNAASKENFTFELRSVYNAGWVHYHTERDNAAHPADAKRAFDIAWDRTSVSSVSLEIRPYAPGYARSNFYICDPANDNVEEGKFLCLNQNDFNVYAANGNVAGTAWILELVDDSDVESEYLPKYIARFGEGYNQLPKTAEVQTALDALAQGFTMEKLMTLTKLRSNVGMKTPEAGRYYRIKLSPVNKDHLGLAVASDYYLSDIVINSDKSEFVKDKTGDNEANTIFYLRDNSDNTTSLLHYSGYYMLTKQGSAFPRVHKENMTLNEPCEFECKPVPDTNSLEKCAYQLLFYHDETNSNGAVQRKTRGVHASIYGTEQVKSDCCGGYGLHDDNDGYYAAHNFQIEEVTELPVEIHSGDNCGTVYLPVAVTVPAGYKVYIASHETTKTKPDGTTEPINRLKLTEAANGVIPAYTPAVIYGNPGICRVAIDYTAEVVAPTEGTDMTVAGNIKATAAAENDNIFIKSTAAAPANAIAMALTDAEGETFKGETASFVRLTSGVVPANSMTFVGTATTPDDVDVPLNTTDGADKPFSLDLETGKATNGITSIAVSKADGTTVIYDLQGRRLTKAAKGINIINGHKVLVK